jgi:hypothetical protein
MSLVRLLYALAVILMPFSYGTKLMIGRPDIVWINPTLILAICIFAIVFPPIRPKISFYIIISSIVSACLGFIFLSPSGGIATALYEIAREPIRLALNLIWFWLTLYMIQTDRKFVVKWLTVSVVIQLLLAYYLWLGILGFTPLPSEILNFLRVYAMAQIVWFNEIPVIRLTGTFTEGPPFGLFMFSALIVFLIMVFKEHDRSKLVIIGAVTALIGVIGSLAMQILLGLAVFTIIWILVSERGRGSRVLKIVVSVITVILVVFIVKEIAYRLSTSGELRAQEAYGKSAGERIFHTVYGINLLLEHPEYILFGVGPGRYGAYVQETGVFRKTVTPQVAIVDWLVGHGIVGLILIGWWLWIIWKKSWNKYALFGIAALSGLIMANLFQGNWLWESWFTALAFLYASRQPDNNSSVKEWE